MANVYAIFYGWLTEDGHGEPNGAARAIAAAKIPLLIAQFRAAPPAGHLNISPQVLALMRSAGTAVYAYTPTQCASTDIRSVQRDVGNFLDADVDGVFFDEADPLRDDAQLGYYRKIVKPVRKRGKGVILNPGVAQCGERIMGVADRVMFEHRWRRVRADSPWASRYAGDRLMGVSSNESNAMGYPVDEARAIADTREAWRAGIGWHASTDLYIRLPDWFAAYVRAVREGSG